MNERSTPEADAAFPETCKCIEQGWEENDCKWNGCAVDRQKATAAEAQRQKGVLAHAIHCDIAFSSGVRPHVPEMPYPPSYRGAPPIQAAWRTHPFILAILSRLPRRGGKQQTPGPA